ncbi:S26 family signal peptidase [Enterocloster bolteae]|uniref:S26 family signal peptidase n=1 Tax=Enterocloster bolteae TaxID=208479 RepID=UPI0028DBC6E1|nr:S26 family signal peptidase [Enterocloster bolteae]
MKCYRFEMRDIITFLHDGKLLVKWVTAVEGDTIERNGVSLTVPEGCYYVLGDNAENSYDSRYWEDPFVSKVDVVAKLILF